MKTSEQLTNLFRERGLRVTPQRQVIFGLLHDNDAHPTVEVALRAGPAPRCRRSR